MSSKLESFKSHDEMMKVYEMRNSISHALEFHFEEIDKEKLFTVIDAGIGLGRAHVNFRHGDTQYQILISII